MIQRLRLQNWRSHSDSEFVFSSGVNALLGIMGSGKSSVMDALCFALFGTFPALNQKKIKLDEVIRARPQQQTSALVELDFKTRNGEVYTVLRQLELNKGTKRAELRKGSQLVEGPSPQGVNVRITKLLKVDYDLFSRAVYSEQNQLDQFLNIPKGQRMIRIDRLLKIDRFETARKTAGTVMNRLYDELSSKEMLSKDILAVEELTSMVQLEKERREIAQRMSALAEKQKRTESKCNGLEAKLRLLEERAEKLNNLKLQREGLKERLAGSQKRFEELGVDVDSLIGVSLESEKARIDSEISKVNQAKEKLDEFECKKAGLASTLEVLENEKIKARAEIDRTPATGLPVSEILEKKQEVFPETETEKKILEELKQIKTVYPDKNSISKALEEQEFRSVEFQKKLESCFVRRKNAKEIIDKLSDKDNCPLCESDLSGPKKEEILQKNKLVLQQIDQEQTSLNAFIIKAKETRDERKSVIERWNLLENELEKIRNEKASKLENIFITAQRLFELEQKIQETQEISKKVEKYLVNLGMIYSEAKSEALRKKLESFVNAKKALELKKTIFELEKDFSEINQIITGAQFDEKELKVVRETRAELIQQNEQQKAQISVSNELLEEKKKRFEDLERKRELAEKYKRDIESIKQGRESLELFQNALKRTQESLRAEFIESVNQVMRDVWGYMYPYDDISGVKLIIDEGDYVLSVHTSSGWVNVEGRVSGGERSLACLALRVAFSLALAPNLSWLVLDEPTHNLDGTSIDLLGETLRERLPSLIEQIFLITHEERLESAVSGQLYKLERNKELDEATRIVT